MSDSLDNPRPEANSADWLKILKDGGGFDVAMSAVALSNFIPLPPSIVKRVRVGFGRLIDGTFEYGHSAIKRKIAKEEFNAQLRQSIVTGMADEGGSLLKSSDPDLATDVALSLINEHGLKLGNREKVVMAAFEDLRVRPPAVDNAPEATIDEDWLNAFAEIAASKSNTEMQSLMGKILAGEIRKPGEFSQLSLRILGTLSQEIAQKFQRLCSVSFCPADTRFISTDMFTTFAAAGIPEIDLSYSDLLKLRSYQLLAVETGTGIDLKVGPYQSIEANDRTYLIAPLTPEAHKTDAGTRRMNLALFTPMGVELARLISTTAPDWFDARVRATFVAPNWAVV